MGGGKGSTTQVQQRELSPEELKLLDTQEKALSNSIDVFNEQFNLSKEDRSYLERIYRGEADPNSPEVQKEVAERLKNVPKPSYEDYKRIIHKSPGGEYEHTEYDRESYEKDMAKWEESRDSIVKQVSGELGDKGVDELLFDAVKNSDTEYGKQLQEWYDTSASLGEEYIKDISGLSGKFADKLTQASKDISTASGEYADQQDRIKKVSDGLSTKFKDIDISKTKLNKERIQTFKQTSKVQDIQKDLQDQSKSVGEIAKKYGMQEEEIQNIQKDFKESSTGIREQLGDITSKMGTADEDVLAQRTGAEMAGISQAYQESRKQLEATMARRGISDSGVEAQALSSNLEAEAMQKAQGFSKAYTGAIQQSDARRMAQAQNLGQQYSMAQGEMAGLQGAVAQQSQLTGQELGAVGMQSQLSGQELGAVGQESMLSQQRAQLEAQQIGATAQQAQMAGQQAQMIGMEAGYTDAQINAMLQQQQLEGQAYNVQQETLGTGYGIQSQLNTANLQNQLNSYQQNIANLAQASGISNQVYTGAQNYLNQSGQTSNSSAQVAGSTASNLNMNTTQTQSGGGSSMLGTLAGGFLGSFTGGVGTNLAGSIKF
jgi:hypothetical protein